MPSRNRIAAAAIVAVGVLALAYSVIVAIQALLGVAAFTTSLLLAAIVYYGGADRRTLVRAMMAITVVYGVFTFQLPVAVVAACVVYLAAWLTGPDSPLDAPDTTILPIESSFAPSATDGPGVSGADGGNPTDRDR